MAGSATPEDFDRYSYVSLKRARLCLDCESIFEGPRCPACASESFVPVTRWIRPTERPAPDRAPQPAPPPPPASRPQRMLKKSLYVGLGAYGVWKMLFEPPQPRKRKPPDTTGPPESPG